MLDKSAFTNRERSETIELFGHPGIVALLGQAADSPLLIIVLN